MDALIYFHGILTDLVVTDLNPDWPPSLLRNPPDLDVKLSHTQPQTFFSQAVLLVFRSFLVPILIESTQPFKDLLHGSMSAVNQCKGAK